LPNFSLFNIDNNVFNSNTKDGKLQYTLPAITDLFGTSDITAFNALNSINISLSVYTISRNSDVWIWENLCTVPSNCNIIYSREFTPIVHALSPPVTYYGAEIGIVVDPKRA
jgi:hypothetical protein